MSPHEPESEPLVIVPVPALGVVLLNLEQQKGSPLTQEEVLLARDKAVCIALPLSEKIALDGKLGYRDINPENVWEEWLLFRTKADRK
jgi:hypothetical protein